MKDVFVFHQCPSAKHDRDIPVVEQSGLNVISGGKAQQGELWHISEGVKKNLFGLILSFGWVIWGRIYGSRVPSGLNTERKWGISMITYINKA